MPCDFNIFYIKLSLLIYFWCIYVMISIILKTLKNYIEHLENQWFMRDFYNLSNFRLRHSNMHTFMYTLYNTILLFIIFGIFKGLHEQGKIHFIESSFHKYYVVNLDYKNVHPWFQSLKCISTCWKESRLCLYWHNHLFYCT
jgi:hypothetical protein